MTFTCDDCADKMRCPFYEPGDTECPYDAMAEAAKLNR